MQTEENKQDLSHEVDDAFKDTTEEEIEHENTLNESQQPKGKIELFVKRNWNTIAMIIMLAALAAMLYYAYQMFRLGRDPCGLCQDTFDMVCRSKTLIY